MNNNFQDIPKIKVSTLQRTEDGISLVKQLNLPNNEVMQTTSFNNIADGTYYSIYELCELIDNYIMKNHILLYDKQTNAQYKLTEEIQHLLEAVPQNLHFTSNSLPEKNGYYIHEKAMQKILERLEKRYEIDKILKEIFLGKIPVKNKEQEKEDKVKKIYQAQEKYLKENTKPKTFFNIKPKTLKDKFEKATAILLTVTAVSIIISLPLSRAKAQNDNYQIQIQEIVEKENPNIDNITVEDLIENIIIGEKYKISSTKIHESSDHTGKTGTIKENYYGVVIIAIVDKNDNIHIVDMKNNNNQKASGIITKEEVKNAKYVSAAIAAPDGTILGWVDITKENFKELSEQIAIEKNKTIETFTVTTNSLNQITHPETGEIFEIISGSLYDENGIKEEDLMVTSITDSNGNIINFEENTQGRGR